MKEIYLDIKGYVSENFNLRLYVVTALFLTASLWINYSLDFKNQYIDPFTRTPWKAVLSFLFQGIPFLITCFFLYFFNVKKEWVSNKNFWLKFLVGFGILSLDLGFYGYTFLSSALARVEYLYSIQVINWASGIFIVVIPLALFNHFFDKDNHNLYGLSPKKINLKPYLILFGIAAVFIAAGSFMGDIQSYYPTYKRTHGDELAAFHNNPEWWYVLFYEITYGSSFISVEFFFRGFLILAFSRILGPSVILPMCVTYCYLHFGKPLGESISSIFGGYILGIITYKTRHIYGGILIHLGVAWLMELLAYLQSLIQ